ncbi:MAG: stage II sporulation protein M [Meiothermus sp.]|uniref:stage II sporulation protein M n=1 Tax=Meiothermus sp. TaxID=1955249 RepID=UPI0028CCF942|nr:stage II sporulation protein M [Meiothermus sp.]MDT7920069.1 stage II sporulation protein M [Meiothermus sp.]
MLRTVSLQTRLRQAGSWLFAAWLLLGLGLAQSSAELARQAVQDWQAGKYQVDPMQALGKPTEEAVRLLERSLAFPPVPPGLSVNLDDPLEEPTPTGTIVKFPATVSGSGGEVRVTIRDGEVTRIGFAPEGGLLPGWLKSPMTWVLFVAFSLGWLVALRSNTPLARWWAEGWALVRQYRGVYLGTNLGLYGLFALGGLVAYANPQLVRLMQELVGGALEQIGLGSALAGGVLGLAVVIFYWNFTNGLLLTTAVPGLLLGIPALLFNALRYFVLGFALSPVALPLANYLLHLPTIVVELQAYILATFGGLVLMLKTLRGEGYRAGLRALGLMVYLGAFFLLVGAWYEAFSILILMRP